MLIKAKHETEHRATCLDKFNNDDTGVCRLSNNQNVHGMKSIDVKSREERWIMIHVLVQFKLLKYKKTFQKENITKDDREF